MAGDEGCAAPKHGQSVPQGPADSTPCRPSGTLSALAVGREQRPVDGLGDGRGLSPPSHRPVAGRAPLVATLCPPWSASTGEGSQDSRPGPLALLPSPGHWRPTESPRKAQALSSTILQVAIGPQGQPPSTRPLGRTLPHTEGPGHRPWPWCDLDFRKNAWRGRRHSVSVLALQVSAFSWEGPGP